MRKDDGREYETDRQYKRQKLEGEIQDQLGIDYKFNSLIIEKPYFYPYLKYLARKENIHYGKNINQILKTQIKMNPILFLILLPMSTVYQ